MQVSCVKFWCRFLYKELSLSCILLHAVNSWRTKTCTEIMSGMPVSCTCQLVHHSCTSFLRVCQLLIVILFVSNFVVQFVSFILFIFVLSFNFSYTLWDVKQSNYVFRLLLSTMSLPVRPHCVNARRIGCQADLNSFSLGEMEETTGTALYYVDEDYRAGPGITEPLPERSSWCGWESSTLENDVYAWCYALIVVHARNEWMNARHCWMEDQKGIPLVKKLLAIPKGLSISKSALPGITLDGGLVK